MIFFLIIFIWGFSEAVWFFIIPDVILSLYALRSRTLQRVFTANIICLSGALLGGAFIYIFSSLNGDTVRSLMLYIPAVHGYMFDSINENMASNTFNALITGPLFGLPYKLFASEAPEYTNIFMFLLFSIPARLIRFLLVSLTAFFLSRVVFKNLSMKLKIGIWSLVWIVVYIIYFSIHSF
ncbi:hypothetical protein [Corticicoccus populi]|uniref:Uncharacterized protein n=1 Tax=Corticicoccus populi TaxID=1812821 RepID=A0ABW5WVG8_9STAP